MLLPASIGSTGFIFRLTRLAISSVTGPLTFASTLMLPEKRPLSVIIKDSAEIFFTDRLAPKSFSKLKRVPRRFSSKERIFSVL